MRWHIPSEDIRWYPNSWSLWPPNTSTFRYLGRGSGVTWCLSTTRNTKMCEKTVWLESIQLVLVGFQLHLIWAGCKTFCHLRLACFCVVSPWRIGVPSILGSITPPQIINQTSFFNNLSAHMYDAYLELLGFQHPSKGFHLHFSGGFKTPKNSKIWKTPEGKSSTITSTKMVASCDGCIGCKPHSMVLYNYYYLP